MDKQLFLTNKMYYGSTVLMISYLDPSGIPNISTISSSFSLDNMVALGFGKNGHAVNAILETREFVINIPNREWMKEIEICGFFSGQTYHKFELTKLTPTRSNSVDAPSIQECPISLECVLEGVYELASNPDLIFLFASIVGRTVDSSLLNEDGTLKSSMVDPVLFVGDTKQRVYRFIEQRNSAVLGSFLLKGDENE